MSAARYTRELQQLAGDSSLFTGDMKSVFARLAAQLSKCLTVERINIWMFNEGQKRIECIGNYTQRTGEFSSGERLQMKDAPAYYARLKSSSVLVVDNVEQSAVTQEIYPLYCLPHGITSMLDVPVHVQGKLKGVVCYEHVGPRRKWTEEEVHFALAANQLLAMALESKEREVAERKMLASVREKELLLKEMHHRIKNNLSVLSSLMRMQGRESNDSFVQSVLSDCERRIFSMAKIHEQLYYSQNYLEVKLDHYLQQLVEEFSRSNINHSDEITFRHAFDPVIFETSRAINLGLIVNEILNNIIKHAFRETNDKPKLVEVSLNQLVSSIMLQIKDNGSGFEPFKQKGKSLGLSLIEDLSEQIDAKLHLQTGAEGTIYMLQFPV